MRRGLVLFAAALALLVADASAEIRVRKVKKFRRTTPSPVEVDKDPLAQSVIYGGGVTFLPPPAPEVVGDPCGAVQCSAGRVCRADGAGEPECVCIEECPYEEEPRRRVCASTNETFGSDCEVHRERCLCSAGRDECKGPKYAHVQVDYYGECREMPDCAPEEMSDFPRRMRDWLFFIMRDLADRHELSDHYMGLEKEARDNLTMGWINAAVWKWCDLNAEDDDRFVSRHELFPIRAPLMSLEHCIGPFLDGCDGDGDHKITLPEWGKCLQLEETELLDKCEIFNETE